MINLRETLISELKSMISNKIGTFIQEIKDDFTATIDFLSDEQKDSKEKIAENEKKIKTLEADKTAA